MNGTKYVFDTNALINFFNGLPTLKSFSNAHISLSIVSIIEFLSFPKIDETQAILLYEFLKEIQVIDLDLSNKALTEIIISTRKTYGLKLPDAIIAATALYLNATLVTNDNDFKKVKGMKALAY